MGQTRDGETEMRPRCCKSNFESNGTTISWEYIVVTRRICNWRYMALIGQN